ncbi:hypothetical protein Holit_02892 [Hollandina sp. SP2]
MVTPAGLPEQALLWIFDRGQTGSATRLGVVELGELLVQRGDGLPRKPIRFPGEEADFFGILEETRLYPKMGPTWNGISPQKDFGYEDETIIQEETAFRALERKATTPSSGLEVIS